MINGLNEIYNESTNNVSKEVVNKIENLNSVHNNKDNFPTDKSLKKRRKSKKSYRISADGELILDSTETPDILEHFILDLTETSNRRKFIDGLYGQKQVHEEYMNELKRNLKSRLEGISVSGNNVKNIFYSITVLSITIVLLFYLQKIIFVSLINELLEKRKLRKEYPHINQWKEKFEKAQFARYGCVVLDPRYIPEVITTSPKTYGKIGKYNCILNYENTYDDHTIVRENGSYYNFNIFQIHHPYIDYSLYVCNYPKNCYSEFWEMVFDNDISTVFAILSCQGDYLSAGNSYYFPKGEKVFGNVTVTRISQGSFLTEYYVYEYSIVKSSITKIVYIYYIYHWRPYKLPYTENCLVEIYDVIKNIPEKTNVIIHSEGSICTRVSSVVFIITIYEYMINKKNMRKPMEYIAGVREQMPGTYIGIGDYNIIMKAVYELLYLNGYLKNPKSHQITNKAFDLYRSRREYNKGRFEENIIPFLSFACDLSVGRVLEILHKACKIRMYNKEVLLKICRRFYRAQENEEKRLKNNYPEIPCQDEFTIDFGNFNIEPDNIDGYVHANLFKYKCKNNIERQIIMTQNPHKKTVDEMLELIYSHNVSVVIHIASYDELGDVNFPLYIPKNVDKKVIHDEFTLVVDENEIDTETGFKISFCEISTEHQSPKRFVHVFINNWYSKDFLTDERVVINTYNTFMKYVEPKRPAVIHCDDGIGRTGVLTLFIHILDFLGESENFDIISHLEFLRKRRLFALPNGEKLLFTIQCLYEYFKFQLYEMNPSVYHRLGDITKNIKQFHEW